MPDRFSRLTKFSKAPRGWGGDGGFSEDVVSASCNANFVGKNQSGQRVRAKI